MNDTRLESGITTGALHGAVIISGALNGNQEVTELVLADGVSQQGDHVLQLGARMFDRGGLQEDASIEVAEHPARALLGAIHGDNSEVLGSDGLDALVQQAAGLGKGEPSATPRRTRGCSSRMNHETTS